MTVTSNHTQACFEAWINCENLLENLAQASSHFSKKISKVVDECALICMGTFHAMKSSSAHAAKMALLCIGICEECAELCEGIKEDNFSQCARICRECSETLSLIAAASLN
jgi:hypothetical protein